MHRYIIMGPQGSGKGSQARLLAERLSLVHISMGEILRSHQARRTDLGVKIDNFMSAGRLVPDEIVNEVLRDRFQQTDWQGGFILDGYPRTEGQAENFLAHHGADAVIVLDVADEVVIGRALNRRLCESCGADYNLVSRPPRTQGVCDSCGGRVIARADDTPEAIRYRLAQYRGRTEPIVTVLSRNAKVIRIDASGTIDEGQSRILKALGAA